MPRKNICIFISVLSFVLSVGAPRTALAQQTKDILPVPASRDSIGTFRGVAVSIDAVGLLQRALSSYGQYEAAVRVNIKDRFFPVAELGWGSANTTNELKGTNYKTRAPYGRIGCDINVAKNRHDDYRIYAGVRYALTAFKYDVSSSIVKDPIWGNYIKYESLGNKCVYHWIEACIGIDAKIAGPLRLGWIARYRGRIHQSHPEVGEPWYVPGFGKKGSSRLGITFNVIFEL